MTGFPTLGGEYLTKRTMGRLVLLWCLVFYAVIPGSVAAAFNAHVSYMTLPGTPIFNASLRVANGQSLLYSIPPALTTDQAKRLVRLNETTGILTLYKDINCTNLLENPFLLHIEVRISRTSSSMFEDGLSVFFVQMPVSVHIHGGHCKLKHAKKEKHRDGKDHTNQKQVSDHDKFTIVIDFPTGLCWNKEEVLVSIEDFLPSSAVNCPLNYTLNRHKSEHAAMLFLDNEYGEVVSAEKFLCMHRPDEKHLFIMLEFAPSCLHYHHYLHHDHEIGLRINVQLDIRAVGTSNFGRMAAADLQDPEVSGRKTRQARRNRSPSFPLGMYIENVPEEQPIGYIVVTVTATDSDSGDGGTLSYSMVAERDARSQSMFGIDSSTGIITTTEMLDRESIEEHFFQLTATDHGSPPRSTTAYLQINVEDVNDHRPEFEQTEYHVPIEENEPAGTTLVELHASDGDTGSNANVEYSILNPEPPNDAFNINYRSGIIMTRARLDREDVANYDLLVQAKDLGTNPGSLNTTTRVIVTVLDENDNYPQFSKRAFQVTLPEDSPRNVVIETITATDRDEGSNAEIRYSMVGGQSHFVIEPYNGEIMLTADLDYESEQSYQLVVRAQDSGRAVRSNTTRVFVTVEDVNDNYPRFPTTHYETSVREDVRVDTPVINLQAFDGDSGEFSRITYSILEVPDTELPFVINPESGQISTSLKLDREISHRFEFTVVASDQGVPPKTATTDLSVVISDVNDNPPIFDQSEYYGRVEEDASPGLTVLTVFAQDPDIGNSVSYRITSGNTRSRFSMITLNNRGMISVALPLDYKQEPRFVLTITASDNEYSSMCLVYINVTDANTYRPVFDQSPYRADVAENVGPGYVVVQVHATDDDVGENARITYSMDDIPTFEIDHNSGEIKTRAELNRELIPSYTIHVTATDNGMEPQLDMTEVEIFLTDVNDNPPIFSQDAYTTEISESVSPQSMVIQIEAEDADEGTNSQISYTFQNGNDGNGAFVIDETSGVIRTALRLDRETKAEYNLVAFAIDGGRPVHRVSVPITVSLKDENDNPPEFPKDEIDVYIEENRNPGELVSRIVANDPDTGFNAFIHYALLDGDLDFFEIDSNTGDLTTLIELDYEARSEYRVTVKATSTPFFNMATVNIHVLDQNDNRPILEDFDIYFNNYEGFFPAGDIGQVPARDPDVSDTLHYVIIRGNVNNHLLLNASTGGIRLHPRLEGTDIPQRIEMGIQVSDGLNAVTAMCTFRLTMITETLLFSSITVQLENIDSQEFLSPKINRFVDALSNIIPTQRNLIYVFSIKDHDIVAGSPVLNVSFAAQHQDGSFFTSQYLQERVYLMRSTLSKVSMATVLPFGDNICLYEICTGEDYYQCISPLSFWSSSGFIATQTVIFRSIHPETLYRCDCPPGFTGNYCTTEINYCYSNPCGGNGQCVQKEAGYTCVCKEKFAGPTCDLDFAKGRCTDNLCKNGGLCRNFLQGGFECVCPDSMEYDGQLCEIRTRNFPEGSFLMFRSLNKRVRFQISLSFATKVDNGLLFYNGRYNQKHDFVALEVVNRQVRFLYSAGEVTSVVTASILGGVSNGQWHRVLVDYHERTATLILDDCNAAVSLGHGQQLGNYSCAAQMTQGGQLKFLDMTGPFIIGGLPTLPEDFPVVNTDFVGCIQDVYIDSELLDLATATNLEPLGTTLPGCPQLGNFCAARGTCGAEGGRCVSEWDGYRCVCPSGWGGRTCQEDLGEVVSFQGNGMLSFTPTSGIVTIPWLNRVVFRTRDDNGVLLNVQLGTMLYTRIEINSGEIHYVTSSAVIILDGVQVNDGQWHDFTAEWKNNQIVLMLDFGKYVKSVRAVDDVAAQTVTAVHAGGLKNDQGSNVRRGFTGCLQGLQIGDAVPTSQELELHNVQPGCARVDVCSFTSCPEHSECKDLWGKYECNCLQGHYGPMCTSACDLNVCQHEAPCVPSSSSPYGYNCRCNDQYFGDNCEHKVETCPEDWWGFKICGPCECDEERGFNSDCNKTTGECYCEEYSYQPDNSDTCYPCDCYSEGSFGPECNIKTGQCQCKRGVIGRACNSCIDPYAEVTLRGCEVVYDSCPRRFAMGIWWPNTKFNQRAKVECPEGAVGMATRECSLENNWLEPNLFSCMSEVFYALQDKLTELQTMKRLNPDLSYSVVEQVHQATLETPIMYGGDVNITYNILLIVLNHESKQEGLNVTAAIKSFFTRKVVEIASSLLDPGNKEHWEVIQETSQGVSSILYSLEAFGANIARTSDYTYTPEFSIVSPNIVMHHDIIVRENFTTVIIPQYEVNQWEDGVQRDQTRIHFPGDAIQPKPELDDPSMISIASNVAVTSYIKYNTIGHLLPNKSDETILPSLANVGQVIFSPVISLSLYDYLAINGTPHKLPSPILFEISTLGGSNDLNPQCIFWNFTLFKGVGGWSSAGCSVASFNSTHVNCSCDHLTNFAVMVDNEYPTMEYIQQSISLQIASYVGLAVSTSALLFTFFTLLCIPRLHCNLNSIHVNLVFTLIAAEVTFMVGINTENTIACTIVAIILHYSLLSAFGWMFIEGIHIYRMMTEVRDINQGPMTYYYVIAYGVPGLIVGLSVPLSENNYGQQVNVNDQQFCWLSLEDILIWSFAGPVLLVVLMNLIVFFMSINVTLFGHTKNPEYQSFKSGLRSAGVLLPLLAITWVFGLLAVNQDMVLYQYLFAAFNCLLGAFIFLFHCVLNSKVRKEWLRCCLGMQGKKVQFDESVNTSRSALSYTKTENQFRHHIGISTGSIGSSHGSRSTKASKPEGYLRNTASTSTTSPSAHEYVPSYYNYKPKVTNLDDDQDSDSDSDASVQRNRDSMSLASSHSSDEEEEEGGAMDMWKTAPTRVNLPDNITSHGLGGLHTSTPKGMTTIPPDNQDSKNKWPGEPYTGETETKLPTSQRAEMKFFDPKFPLDNDRDNSVTGSVAGSVTGSIDGSNRNLIVSQVSARPDILPLKGIMKAPGSSHKGSSHGSGSGSGSNASLTKIPMSLTTTPDKYCPVLGTTFPPEQRSQDSESDGSSNETSV